MPCLNADNNIKEGSCRLGEKGERGRIQPVISIAVLWYPWAKRRHIEKKIFKLAIA